MSAMSTERVDYGIDAPGIVRMVFMLVTGVLAAAFAFGLAPWPGFPWGVVIAGVLGLVAAYLLGLGCLMLYGSKVGKLRRRDRLFELVPWTGAEMVLDVGCGRGLMLIGAAKRLTTGKAVGIDLWKAQDQSNNNPEATLTNARLEGVSERVEVHTSDMRSLRFEDGTFDVIVSHWAVHNLEEQRDRKTALKEMARVLKPGGYIVLADVARQDEYAHAFTEFGLRDVKVLVENDLMAQLSSAFIFCVFRFATVFARK
jgi:ubiquinone/menaquinone biosynthesis C-methylase UbiE